MGVVYIPTLERALGLAPKFSNFSLLQIPSLVGVCWHRYSAGRWRTYNHRLRYPRHVVPWPSIYESLGDFEACQVDLLEVGKRYHLIKHHFRGIAPPFKTIWLLAFEGFSTTGPTFQEKSAATTSCPYRSFDFSPEPLALWPVENHRAFRLGPRPCGDRAEWIEIPRPGEDLTGWQLPWPSKSDLMTLTQVQCSGCTPDRWWFPYFKEDWPLSD